MTSFIMKNVGIALAFAFVLTCAGVAMAADTIDEVDRDLKRTGDQLSRDLDQSLRQTREAERLGVTPDTPNRFGTRNEIDRDIQKNVDKANRELDRATERDHHNAKRRELENTRSLYTPDSREYRRITQEMDKLDRDFNAKMRQKRMR